MTELLYAPMVPHSAEWGDARRTETRELCLALLDRLEVVGYPAKKVAEVEGILRDAGALGAKA